MPSPIAHAAAGYVVYRTYQVLRTEAPVSRIGGLIPRPLIPVLFFSLLPDSDFLPGLLVGDFDRFHNTITNSLFVGLLFAMAVGLIARLWRRLSVKSWFMLALAGYELHVLMDLFTVGRGLMLLWPFSSTRFAPPIKFFYGLHRSEGLISIRHLWTLLTELGFVLLVVVGMHLVISWVSYRRSGNAPFKSFLRSLWSSFVPTAPRD